MCKDIERCNDIKERVKLLDEMKNCQKIIESGNNVYAADSIRLARELSAIEKAVLYDKLVIHKDHTEIQIFRKKPISIRMM